MAFLASGMQKGVGGVDMGKEFYMTAVKILLWLTTSQPQTVATGHVSEACWGIRDGRAYVMNGSVDSIARQVWIARR